MCLLDKAGKLFERIIVNRFVHHLSCRSLDIDGAQHGFRVGLSTLSAIQRVRGYTDAEVSQGRVVLAVSLDISNAFNTLPWEKIRRALTTHGVPLYLRRVVGAYLQDRWITYRDERGSYCEVRIDRGVPQGSVLGLPLLWNLEYDAVLRTFLPPGCELVAYADDTLILAGGKNWGRVLSRTEVSVSCVVRSIRGLGLRMAAEKTQAMFFHSWHAGSPPPDMFLPVKSAHIRIQSEMKYLGLILDGGWRFSGHFSAVAKRTRVRAVTLSRLLPNLGGPSGKVRRLYVNTVRSVALYGAPIWADALAALKRGQTALDKAVRPMINKMCRAYRSVSRTAAAVLAGFPPGLDSTGACAYACCLAGPSGERRRVNGGHSCQN